MAEATEIDPIEDPDEYWELHRIFNGPGEDGTIAEWYSRSAVDLEEDLRSWLSGSANRQKNHGSFLMMSGVDHCIKGGRSQYHFFVGPNIKYEGTTHKPEEIGEGSSAKNFYDAMAFACLLMSQHGRVWTHEVWEKVGDTEVSQYPLLCAQEFRSPVLCIFQADGHTFAFGLCEDAPNEYGAFNQALKHDKKLGKQGRKHWRKQRGRNVTFDFSNQMLALKKGGIPGLNVAFEKKGILKSFTQLEELSGPNLESWVTGYISTLDH